MGPSRSFLRLLLIITLAAALEPSQARSDEQAEEVFRSAKTYTVRIRTQIMTPFVEDSRGSFEGAGFLVDATRGWILTNAHVVGRSPSQVQVAFASGTFRPARKIYVDPYSDIAVIQVTVKDPKHAVGSLNCDRFTEIGEPIGAFGHPLGMPFTGSRGIVSGKTDQLGPDFLQIDATVDHGNSGGPVISLRDGTVVGIATAGVGGNKADRVNFATPIRDACRILTLLREGRDPSPPHTPFSLLKDEDDRLTLQVESTDDSERWPLRQGDHIIGVQGRDSCRTFGELVTDLRGQPGSLSLLVERDGKHVTVEVKPRLQPPVVQRRGISLDGALIAALPFEDGKTLREPSPFVVQSVEPGSVAEMLGLAPQDLVRTVDGRRFDDLERLVTYLAGKKDPAVKLVVRRWSGEQGRIFEYHLRQLPGEDVHIVETTFSGKSS